MIAMETASERRLEERIAFRVPAHITVRDRLIRGYVINLSEWGAFVLMDEPADLDGEIHLDFDIGRSFACAATGKLAHSVAMGNAMGFGIGLSARNVGYASFIRNLESASNLQIMQMIRDMKRIDVRVG